MLDRPKLHRSEIPAVEAQWIVRGSHPGGAVRDLVLTERPMWERSPRRIPRASRRIGKQTAVDCNAAGREVDESALSTHHWFHQGSRAVWARAAGAVAASAGKPAGSGTGAEFDKRRVSSGRDQIEADRNRRTGIQAYAGHARQENASDDSAGQQPDAPSGGEIGPMPRTSHQPDPPAAPRRPEA